VPPPSFDGDDFNASVYEQLMEQIKAKKHLKDAAPQSHNQPKDGRSKLNAGIGDDRPVTGPKVCG